HSCRSSSVLLRSSCGYAMIYLFTALRPPVHTKSTFFPYTTLFRSCCALVRSAVRRVHRACHQQRQLRRVSPIQRQIGNPLNGRKDRKSTRLNSSHQIISYAVFCLTKYQPSHTTIDRRASTPHTSRT